MNEPVFMNYKLRMAFGNKLGKRYSKNMILIILYERDSIIFIPSYDTSKYPFPPLNKEQEYIIRPKIEDRITKRRIDAFREAPVIFFEDNERAGQHFNLDFEYNVKMLESVSYIKKRHIIYCVNSKTYQWLYKTLRKDFYEFSSGHSFNRENSIHNKALRFIEEKLIDLKDDLPELFRKHVFRKEG